MASEEPIRNIQLYVPFQNVASQFLSCTLLHICVQAAFIVSALKHRKSESTQTDASYSNTVPQKLQNSK